MLPPSLLDLNLDGLDDVVVLTHDGMLVVLSGTDLNHLWGPFNFTMKASTETYA